MKKILFGFVLFVFIQLTPATLQALVTAETKSLHDAILATNLIENFKNLSPENKREKIQQYVNTFASSEKNETNRIRFIRKFINNIDNGSFKYYMPIIFAYLVEKNSVDAEWIADTFFMALTSPAVNKGLLYPDFIIEGSPEAEMNMSKMEEFQEFYNQKNNFLISIIDIFINNLPNRYSRKFLNKQNKEITRDDLLYALHRLWRNLGGKNMHNTAKMLKLYDDAFLNEKEKEVFQHIVNEVGVINRDLLTRTSAIAQFFYPDFQYGTYSNLATLGKSFLTLEDAQKILDEIIMGVDFLTGKGQTERIAILNGLKDRIIASYSYNESGAENEHPLTVKAVEKILEENGITLETTEAGSPAADDDTSSQRTQIQLVPRNPPLQQKENPSSAPSPSSPDQSLGLSLKEATLTYLKTNKADILAIFDRFYLKGGKIAEAAKDFVGSFIDSIDDMTEFTSEPEATSNKKHAADLWLVLLFLEHGGIFDSAEKKVFYDDMSKTFLRSLEQNQTSDDNTLAIIPKIINSFKEMNKKFREILGASERAKLSGIDLLNFEDQNYKDHVSTAENKLEFTAGTLRRNAFRSLEKKYGEYLDEYTDVEKKINQEIYKENKKEALVVLIVAFKELGYVNEKDLSESDREAKIKELFESLIEDDDDNKVNFLDFMKSLIGRYKEIKLKTSATDEDLIAQKYIGIIFRRLIEIVMDSLTGDDMAEFLYHIHGDFMYESESNNPIDKMNSFVLFHRELLLTKSYLEEYYPFFSGDAIEEITKEMIDKNFTDDGMREALKSLPGFDAMLTYVTQVKPDVSNRGIAMEYLMNITPENIAEYFVLTDGEKNAFAEVVKMAKAVRDDPAADGTKKRVAEFFHENFMGGENADLPTLPQDFQTFENAAKILDSITVAESLMPDGDDKNALLALRERIMTILNAGVAEDSNIQRYVAREVDAILNNEVAAPDATSGAQDNKTGKAEATTQAEPANKGETTSQAEPADKAEATTQAEPAEDAKDDIAEPQTKEDSAPPAISDITDLDLSKTNTELEFSHSEVLRDIFVSRSYTAVTKSPQGGKPQEADNLNLKLAESLKEIATKQSIKGGGLGNGLVPLVELLKQDAFGKDYQFGWMLTSAINQDATDAANRCADKFEEKSDLKAMLDRERDFYVVRLLTKNEKIYKEGEATPVVLGERKKHYCGVLVGRRN